MMRDLGSTNGTKVDGQKIGEAPLQDGTTLLVGRTSIVFRVIPVAAPPAQDDATRAFGVSRHE